MGVKLGAVRLDEPLVGILAAVAGAFEKLAFLDGRLAGSRAHPVQTRHTVPASAGARTDEFPCRGRSIRQGMFSAAANSVIHLELHTGDLAGAVAFYSELFGWRGERIQAGAASYLALGMGSRLGGGVVQCPVADQPVWLPYVAVPDIVSATMRAEHRGGDLVLPPREGPEGWRAVVATPEAGEVAFWEAKRRRR